MIRSKNSRRVILPAFVNCALLVGTILLPVGFSSAQDFDAIEGRLEEAVSKGELTLDQVKVLMNTLKNLGDNKSHSKSRDKSLDLKFERNELLALREEIAAAIKAGEITEKQARQRWEEYGAGKYRGGAADNKKPTGLEAAR
ncbi:MAG: hypothetical protein ACI9HK_001250, partial [Pirellulaceae bacterium]